MDKPNNTNVLNNVSLRAKRSNPEKDCFVAIAPRNDNGCNGRCRDINDVCISICLPALVFFFLGLATGYCAKEESPLFWPPPPAEMRISFVESVYSSSGFGIKPGFFKKLKKMIIGERKDVLSKPLAIAVDGQKTIYVCDGGAPALHIFMQKEKRYKKITSVNKEGFLSPVGVVVSDQGLVFVADSKLRKVFCLDKDGRFKFVVGKDKEFLRPVGLAINKERLYVADTLKHSILIFDLEGHFISEFGSRGKEPGEFNYPTSIAVDNEGRIYVTDALNFRIQVFDKNNEFLYAFGRMGDSSGSFARPKGIAIDSFGHVYVTDGIFDNIQIFNQEREFLLSFGESGHKDGEFWIPSGVAIDKEDNIYVADSYNQRIQIFQYVGKE